MQSFRRSVAEGAAIRVTRAAACTLSVTLLNTTSSAAVAASLHSSAAPQAGDPGMARVVPSGAFNKRAQVAPARGPDYGNGHKFKVVGLAVTPDCIVSEFARNAQDLFHEFGVSSVS